LGVFLFQVRLFQNFSFWNSFLEFSGKTGFCRFFQEPGSKPTGFWNRLRFSVFEFGIAARAYGRPSSLPSI
jgi:hypothetical protein